MDAEPEKCIEICVGALNGRAGEDDDLPVLQTFERLSGEPYRGRGLGIGDTGGARLSRHLGEPAETLCR
jgi:hypothetical protein